MPAADPHTTDAVLRACVAAVGARSTVTLDRRFQGLPDTAHGGTVLALFDAVGHVGGTRSIAGVYHRRVPLERPLSLVATAAGETTRFVLSDGATPLVTAETAHGAAGAATAPAPAPVPGDGASPLPLSASCFACGIDNPLGLRARLTIDDHAVGGPWEPPPALRTADGALAPVAITSLLDEAAFWLGAAASGESGMTTDLRVALHRPVAFGRPLLVTGRRDAVRARPDDPRYWDTQVQALDEDGALVAGARITFVAVRGAARKLVAGLLTRNSPDVLRAVFPSHVR